MGNKLCRAEDDTNVALTGQYKFDEPMLIKPKRRGADTVVGNMDALLINLKQQKKDSEARKYEDEDDQMTYGVQSVIGEA